MGDEMEVLGGVGDAVVREGFGGGREKRGLDWVVNSNSSSSSVVSALSSLLLVRFHASFGVSKRSAYNDEATVLEKSFCSCN